MDSERVFGHDTRPALVRGPLLAVEEIVGRGIRVAGIADME
jgi:hypothetical protein